MDPAEREIEISAESAERLRGALAGPALDQITRQRLIERGAPALANRRRTRGAWRTVGGLAAAVALVSVTSLLVLRAPSTSHQTAESQLALVADINADGVVDILDAHALATAIESGSSAPDLDADGATTRADADWIADAVTRLEGASG